MEISKLIYPNNELREQEKLNRLFSTWIDEAQRKKFIDNRTEKDLVLDGFYPHYFNQKYRILFIGRESLGLSGDNYIDLMHHAYTNDKKIGKQTLNQHRLHSLKLSIAYGLNNNSLWDDIPPASEIANDFATDKGVSFAFMNLSKLSNESGGWDVDWELVDSFVDAFQDSSINFFSKQIDILNPNIILTMNLEGRLKALGEVTPMEYTENAAYYTLKTTENSYLLIDLFHFSATNKSHKECFYKPVVKGIKRFL